MRFIVKKSAACGLIVVAILFIVWFSQLQAFAKLPKEEGQYMNVELQAVLDFWFGALDSGEYGQFKKFWFNSTKELDEEIRSQFLELTLKAKAGVLDSLAQTPEDQLALIIVLDQFPRNLFRNTADAFASDAKALEFAKAAISQSAHEKLPIFMRPFMYLPLEHSEALSDQDLAVSLFQELGNPSFLEYAKKHQEVIKRFGRFPHRNIALKRRSTAAEMEFLAKEPMFF
jgi:uncharacterized protein (DUF924 family)